MMEVAGIAGSVKPMPVGQLKGSKVKSYVWPTNLDPSIVGFDKESGILALAITAHPDFNGEVPLLCVSGVHDVASGDLSLPGRVTIQN